MSARARLLLGAAIVGQAALLSGCGTTMVRRSLEKRVERRLAEVLGPARDYDVRIKGTRDARLVRGRASRVEIEGSQILARSQFLLDSLTLHLEDLHYLGEPPYYVTVQRSELEIEFTETALNDYLKTYQARYEPEVRFEPDRVRVSIRYPFLGSPVPIQATGRFHIEEGRRLLFDAETADVSFLDAPGFGEKFVEDRVNPLLDLGKLDFPARLERIQVLQGRLRAQGTASLPRED